MQKRIAILLLCLFAASTAALGQGSLLFPPYDIPYFKRYAHPKFSHTILQGGVGISIYSGDLAKPISANQQGGFLNPNLSIGLEHQLTHFIGLRLEGGYFRLRAKPLEGQWSDTGFKSNNWEVYGALVHRLFPKYHFESVYKGFDPYAFVGFGYMGFSTKPTGNITPESGNASGIAQIIPIGLGFNYHFRGNLWLSLEGGIRFVTSDLIDNASVAEDPNPRNDSYYLYRIKINYQPKKDFFYPHFLRRKRVRF